MGGRLAGRVALVTGGSRGIGAGIVRALADEGARVVLTYRERKADAERVVSAIEAGGGEATIACVDVRVREQIRAAVELAEARFGGLDVLVSNAGVNQPCDFDRIDEAAWDEVLGVNLKGPFLCAQEAIAAMQRRGGGSIVQIGSVSGQYGGPRTAHYAASKAGLISLGQVIARFGAKSNVRVNTVAAGLIESEMAEAGLASGAVAQAAEGIVMRRLGRVDEVAAAVVFLASDESSYVTAQTLNVNGGLYF